MAGMRSGVYAVKVLWGRAASQESKEDGCAAMATKKPLGSAANASDRLEPTSTTAAPSRASQRVMRRPKRSGSGSGWMAVGRGVAVQAATAAQKLRRSTRRVMGCLTEASAASERSEAKSAGRRVRRRYGMASDVSVSRLTQASRTVRKRWSGMAARASRRFCRSVACSGPERSGSKRATTSSSSAEEPSSR